MLFLFKYKDAKKIVSLHGDYSYTDFNKLAKLLFDIKAFGAFITNRKSCERCDGGISNKYMFIDNTPMHLCDECLSYYTDMHILLFADTEDTCVPTVEFTDALDPEFLKRSNKILIIDSNGKKTEIETV